MKTRSILMTTLCALMMGAGFASCSDSEDWEDISTNPYHEYYTYILNEGLWGANNANITAISIQSSDNEIKNKINLYEKKNGQKLGDLANAMIEEDKNIYVVLNGSKYVARLDQTANEKARYTIPEGEGEPRCIAVEDEYAYVTQHGGQISKLNIEDMTLVSTFKGGDNLEGIVEENGKLYVANAWKIDGSNNYLYNKELLVIDAKTMKLEGTIPVVDNPVNMYEFNDKIYVISQGNYADVQAALQVIDTKTRTSKVILKDVDKITEGFNGWIYGVRSTYDTNWNPINTFFIYNPKNDEINETSFLQDAPSSFSSSAIYLLEVDEDHGFIYVGTSDYTNSGTIYQFNRNGKLIQSFDSGGINPSTMIFFG